MHLPRTSEMDALIIIPTIATSSVLLPSFERLLQHLDGLRVHIVVAVNPLDDTQAAASIAGMQHLWGQHGPAECALSIYRHPGPCGFGGAINRGLRLALDCGGPEGDVVFNTFPVCLLGLPPVTVIWNDDLHVTDGWLLELIDALNTAEIMDLSEVPNEDGSRPSHPVAEYGRIGMVGPVTNVAAGMQMVSQEHQEAFSALGLDAFAARWHEQMQGQVFAATFLSGYCMAFSADFVEDLVVGEGSDLALFDERYLIAGYEDNDLCARADRAGWRAAIAYGTFIGHLGHQSFDSDFPDMDRGMRNRLTYYNVWKPEIEKQGERLVACYRIRLDVPNDLNLLRMSMAGVGRLVDGVAILLTGPLAMMRDSEDWAQMQSMGQLPGDAVELAGCPAGEDARALRAWALQWTCRVEPTRRPDVVVKMWDGQFNERDERNACLQMGRNMGADWIISIDHDEVLEPRVTRPMLERLMHHPDPLIQSWDFSWINHWANNRWQNLTPPWGDGGRYTGGMHGFRMFRVCQAKSRQIMAGGTNGLHCGNIPMTGPITKRVSGFRFRHFGYMRVQDRNRKLDRYNIQDPTPNPRLVGGTTYAHITHEENQLMSAFAPVNGIGLHCLLYEDEKPGNVARHLDAMYGLADRIVLVWTGEWTDADRRLLYGEPVVRHEGNQRGTLRPVMDLWDDSLAWPETGPSREMAQMVEHFQCEWVHQPLNDHIGNARNAALDALHATPGLGWALFFDPDEYMPMDSSVMLRRMAEVTDAWGWLMRFRNGYEDGGYNYSEAVRLSRLDSGGLMRMNGRVHESFSKAVKHLVAEGYGSVLRHAPERFVCVNTGLAVDPEALQDKLDRYKRLVEMDLREEPNNPGAWVTLGLYWLNEGHEMVALECYSRAMMLATDEFLPFHEAALEYMRLAKSSMEQAAERMGGHRNRQVVDAIVDMLGQAAPPLPRLGVPGRCGVSLEDAMAGLPPLVREADGGLYSGE